MSIPLLRLAVAVRFDKSGDLRAIFEFATYWYEKPEPRFLISAGVTPLPRHLQVSQQIPVNAATIGATSFCGLPISAVLTLASVLVARASKHLLRPIFRTLERGEIRYSDRHGYFRVIPHQCIL